MGAGNAIRVIAWAAAITLTARHASGCLQLAGTLAWLRRPQAPPPAARIPPPVHVIIPVLREQEHVGPALDWWRQVLPQFPSMSLTLVSTAREERERRLLAAAACSARRLTSSALPQLSPAELAGLASARAEAGGQLTPPAAERVLARKPLTSEVIDRLLAPDDPPRIRHVTYPGTGRKAAQVNHAAMAVPDGGYIAVYDIDSRPAHALLAATCAQLAAPGPGPAVVQQHALHAAPPPGGQLADSRLLARSAAAAQSVWTLRREIPYARRYQRSAGDEGLLPRLRAGLPQPVGHGLFLRQDAHAAIGGLPETTVLDDVPAGILLALLDIPVVSIAQLAEVPAPAVAAEVITQHRRWFCSYLDYPALLGDAARAGYGDARHRRLLAAIAAYRGAAWLAASPLTAAAMVTAACPWSGRGLRLTACAGLILAAAAPAVMITAARQGRVRPGQAAADSALILVGYLVRSAGPWLAVWDAARGRHPASPAALSPKTHRREGAVP